MTLLGLFIHALFYSGFLEDPLTWLVIAIAAAYSMEPVPRRRAQGGRRGVTQREGLVLSGVLLVLVAITLPELGSDPWHFRPPSVDPQGPLAPLVRAAGEEWDVGIARSAAFVAALLCGAVAALLIWRPQPLAALDRHRARAHGRRAAGGAVDAAPARSPRLDRALVLHERLDLPGRARRRARCSTSTTRTGTTTATPASSASTPATAATRSASASARWRSATSPTSPGAVVSAAAWRLLPDPFDDYRLLVLLATLALLPAALLFRGPLGWRLALGAVLVCNPIAVRSAWFGQNDAPSLLLLVLAFALVTRRRFGWAAAALAGAILLKQFAIVALPFMALMIPREEWKRPASSSPACWRRASCRS